MIYLLLGLAGPIASGAATIEVTSTSAELDADGKIAVNELGARRRLRRERMSVTVARNSMRVDLLADHAHDTRASMIANTGVVVMVAMLIAAHLVTAGPAGAVPCCFSDGACRELSPGECESSGGDFPLASTCDDPNPCIVCCRSGEPVSCEDNVTFRNCVTRPNLVQYPSRAACNTEGQCVTIQGGDCTDAAQCTTGFCADGVCCDTACTSPNAVCDLLNQRGTCTDVTRAPALSWGTSTFLAALLCGGAVFALRRGIP